MTISPTQHSDFSSFLAVISTDKPVNRSKFAYALMFLRLEGFFFRDIHKTQFEEGVWANWATEYEKYVAGKCTRTSAPLARSTQIEY